MVADRDKRVAYLQGRCPGTTISSSVSSRFNDSRSGGVVVEHRRGGFTLGLEATGAPIARLKSVDESDHMRVLY